MKPFFVSLFVCFALLNCSRSAFCAGQHSWLVVTRSSDGGGSNIKEQTFALRDDGQVRRSLPPVAAPTDYHTFSPDGKHWLDVVYDQGFSVATSRKYLLVGSKGESEKDKKPFGGLHVEAAQWTPDNTILLSSGSVDWSVGTQAFSYSIIDPVTGKDVVDLKPLRARLFASAKYERDAALSPGNSQLVFVAQTTAFGGLAADYDSDRNNYLVSFDWKKGTSSIIAAFKAIGPPQWNSAGTECVFSSSTGWNRNANSLSSNLYVCSPKDSDAIFPLTFSPFANSAPTWSPDGKRIAWISNRPLKEGGKSDKKRLYVMDADGTNQKLLAPDLVNVTTVRWQKEEPK